MKLFKRVIIAIGLTLSLSLVSISLANEVKKVERVASKHKNQPLIKASKKVKTELVLSTILTVFMFSFHLGLTNHCFNGSNV